MTSEQSIRQSFVEQALSCEKLGSPFTARLCRLSAERLNDDTDVGAHILAWPGNPSGRADALALRFAGALRALVIAGTDEQLAAAYPPNEASEEVLWAAVSSALGRHSAFMIDRLASAPQTNEVRRSGALLPGFLTLGRMFAKPFMLSEVGGSAGLNLHWDRYRYRLGDFAWGDPGSAVTIAVDWRGHPPPSADIVIAERSACDLKPVDPAKPDDRLRMLSYIWADQADRIDRTTHALDIAAASSERVERADAIDWLARRLDIRNRGTLHIVYHSIAWQYFPPALKVEGEALIEAAGKRATADAPFARLQMEADESDAPGAALTLQIWPTGEKHEIGRADFHGRWVEWVGWPGLR